MKLFLSAVATATLFSLGAFAETLTGTISDSGCGAKHANATEASTKCVEKCVKGGAAPVLISGDKVLKIKNADKVMDHLGHKVTITGKVDGDMLTVDSVKM